MNVEVNKGTVVVKKKKKKKEINLFTPDIKKTILPLIGIFLKNLNLICPKQMKK